MKKFYSLLIFSFLFINAMAQVPPWEWVKQGGESGTENTDRVARDHFGNIYVAGNFSGTATFATTNITSNGAADIYVAKYDSSGALLWIQHHGGAGDDRAVGIAVDSMGQNIFVSGWYSGTVTFGTFTIPSAGSQDLFVAKYNSSGTIQWVQHGGSAVNGSFGFSITYDEPNQIVYASGMVGASAQFNSVTYTNAYGDVFLAKYTLAGTLLWARFYGGPSDDAGNDITTDPAGNVYITGYCKSVAHFGSFTLTSSGAEHSVFTAKFDSSGNVLWAAQALGVGSTRDNDGYSVSFDKINGYVNVTGSISGTAHFGSTVFTSYGLYDMFIAQYDSSGNLRWVKRCGGTGKDAGGPNRTDNQSNIYVTGHFTGSASFNDTSITGTGGTDIFVAKYNSSGTCLWVKQAGGTGDDSGNGIAVSPNADEIYVSGTFTGPAAFESFNLNGYGSTDAFVGKIATPRPPDCISLVLQPDSTAGKDAWINSLVPNVNYGYSEEIDAIAWTVGGNPSNLRSTLQFDLSSIPSIATIQSAILTLYYDPTSQNGSGQHYHAVGSNQSSLRRITGAWSEYGITWNNQPATTTLNQVTLPQDTNPQENYILDVRLLVQDMINNPSSSFGFMLQLDTEQYYRGLNFASSDHPNEALHPKLELCYTVGPEGVTEISRDNQFIVYPNPSTGNITVSFQNTLQKGTVEIFNSIGQEIYSEKILNPVSKKEINLNAAAGIYFVKVSDGEKVFTRKLIIEY